MADHKVIISLDELTGAKAGQGFGVDLKYIGTSDEGITEAMGFACVSALLKAMGIDGDESDSLIEMLAENAFPGRTCVAQSGPREKCPNEQTKAETIKAFNKKLDERDTRSATEMFVDMIKDSRWVDVMRNNKSFSCAKICAFVASVLHAIEATQGKDSKAYKYVEKLFLDEVAKEGKDDE